MNLIAGDTYERTVKAPAEVVGWSPVIVFHSLFGTVQDAGTAVGDDFVFSVSSAKTATLAPGVWTVAIVATNEGNRKTIDSRKVEVKRNPLGTPDTHNRRCLALVQSAIEGRFVDQAESISYLGQSLQLLPMAELRRLQAEYLKKVRDEERGGSNPRFRIGGFR